MKKIYLFLVITILTFAGIGTSLAQMVGTNTFLQGHWLEIGMINNDAFGTSTAPAGYHPHGSAGVGEVYDWGHDGWAVGAPAYMGDYTLPGFPTEGWSMQVNGLYNNAWQAGGFPGTGSLTGAPVSYSNAGGRIIGNWSGTASAGGLSVKQETRVDTEASWVVVTTLFKNTTAAPIANVYYERTCDPDNDETWPGGSFTTANTIVHQNDLDHRVQVTAIGNLGASAFMSLCTKDCRAKCFIIPFSLTPVNSLSDIWNEAGTASGYYYTGSNTNDEGIGLVYNLGTIAPGDSAIISYAYVFSNNNGIDSALPDPQLVVNGVPVTNALPPNPTIDTFNTCSVPGMTSLPVSILYATDKDWSWSSWTWTPSTGLTSTTGTSVIININLLTGPTTFTITGTDSATGMKDCNNKVFLLTILPCHTAHNNSPCEGDTLKLWDFGDSTGATYAWTGPGGFTSTQQYISIFPAVFSDSGLYHVIKTIGTVHDSDSTYVYIRPKPILNLTTNAPLCFGMVDTLTLGVTPFTPGETFLWSGPAGYTSTQQYPTINGFVPIDSGMYRVIGTTSWGCKDTAFIDIGMIPQPLPPTISQPRYCQGTPFGAYTISGLVPGGYVIWYPSGTGGTGTLIPTPINTTVPQKTKVYFSQKSGGCESKRDSITVWVVTTPAAPTVTGTMQYCQFIGPVTTLNVMPATADTLSWYYAATGGIPYYTEPLPNITTAGIYNYWVSQTDTGCESSRTPVTITIHPKPSPPIVTQTPWCQFRTPGPVVAAPSGIGDFLLWYGPGVTAGSTVAPTPGSLIAPDTISYYVTETTIYGCVSDSSLDVVVIKVKPPVPLTKDIAYCQHDIAKPLNWLVDSIATSHLNWYYNGTSVTPTPTPVTDTLPGTYTWYVSQTVPNNITGCEGDSASVSVRIVYKPVFGIQVSAPFVCQYDSLTLSYCCGPALFAAGYLWTLPAGATAVGGTSIYDSIIRVEFDAANQNNYVVLRASDDSNFCASYDTVRIKVIAQPTMLAFTKGDVCLGDTTLLGLTDRSSGASIYTWYIDSVLMANSTAITTISANSNSGGPFLISWVDSGKHVVMVTTKSTEGCKSRPAFDSINVHASPDASFKILGIDSGSVFGDKFCLEDSVQFSANAINYSYSYAWAPSHSFANINQAVIFGKMESTHSIITLKVTDPFGCYATTNMELTPGTCCAVTFPDAFTPNGDGKNDVFRPIFPAGSFHRFHKFQVANRWGAVVFEGGNSNTSWDGTLNGVPQDMGVYFYYIKYDCGGSTFETKGDVTLIR